MSKERGFNQVLCNLGEWWTPVSKPISSFCHGKSPTVNSKAKTKASVHSSCSILEYCALEPAAAAEHSQTPPRQVSLFLADVLLRLSPAACVQNPHGCGPAMQLPGPHCCVLLARERWNTWAQCIIPSCGAVGVGGERDKKKADSLLEVVGEQASAVCECRSRVSQLLFSPGMVLAWVWGRLGAFSKQPINLPNFPVLWVHLSTNSFFPQARQASLVPHLPLHHFYLCVPVLAFPGSYPQFGTKVGEGLFKSNFLACFLCVQSKNLPLLQSWPMGEASQRPDCLFQGNSNTKL